MNSSAARSSRPPRPHDGRLPPSFASPKGDSATVPGILDGRIRLDARPELTAIIARDAFLGRYPSFRQPIRPHQFLGHGGGTLGSRRPTGGRFRPAGSTRPWPDRGEPPDRFDFFPRPGYDGWLAGSSKCACLLAPREPGFARTGSLRMDAVNRSRRVTTIFFRCKEMSP